MNKLVKALLSVLLIILLLVASGLAYVLFAIDPNDYKPQIEKAASEQNVDLDISGDLSWQFLPSLAIGIGKTSISSSSPDIPDISFNSASLRLDWLPLLKNQIHISAITIDGADIHIASSEQAVTTSAAPVAASSEASNADGSFGLAVDSVKITNSRITLPGSSPDQVLALNGLSFEGQQINLEGQSFPITLSFDYSDGNLPGPIHIDLDTKISFNLNDDALVIKGLTLRSGELTVALDASISQLTGTPEGTGSIQISTTDIKAVLGDFDISLPDMPDKTVLSNFKLDADFSSSTEQVQIQALKIALDDTQVTGEARVKLSKPMELSVTLSGDTIDLNRYLAAGENGSDETADNSATPKSAQTQAQLIFAPLIAPMAFLDGGTSTLEFNWDKILMDDLTVDAIHLASTTTGYSLNISDFSANTLGGSIKSTARLSKLTSKNPILNFSAQLDDISLAEASKTFAEGVDTSGTLTARVKGKSSGATSDQIFDHLAANGTLNIVDPELKTINIEQSYCQVAAMVEKIPAKADWSPGTTLNDVDGKFRMQGRTLHLDGLSSGVGNLKLNASGEIDLGVGTFNILAITRLIGDRTSDTGCIIKSRKLRDRDIPLRCKDSFEKASAKSCLPDGDIIRELAKDKILEKLGEKSGLSEEASQAVDSLLKGLFGR